METGESCAAEDEMELFAACACLLCVGGSIGDWGIKKTAGREFALMYYYLGAGG